jgi:hypothetical protein
MPDAGSITSALPGFQPHTEIHPWNPVQTSRGAFNPARSHSPLSLWAAVSSRGQNRSASLRTIWAIGSMDSVGHIEKEMISEKCASIEFFRDSR